MTKLFKIILMRFGKEVAWSLAASNRTGNELKARYEQLRRNSSAAHGVPLMDIVEHVRNAGKFDSSLNTIIAVIDEDVLATPEFTVVIRKK